VRWHAGERLRGKVCGEEIKVNCFFFVTDGIKVLKGSLGFLAPPRFPASSCDPCSTRAIRGRAHVRAGRICVLLLRAPLPQPADSPTDPVAGSRGAVWQTSSLGTCGGRISACPGLTRANPSFSPKKSFLSHFFAPPAATTGLSNARLPHAFSSQRRRHHSLSFLPSPPSHSLPAGDGRRRHP
jgi:hypothetical protein